MVKRHAAIFAEFVLAIILSSVLVITSAAARAQEFPFKFDEQEELSASVLVREDIAQVRWRFLELSASRQIEVSAAVNGRPLEKPALQSYSVSGSGEPGARDFTLLLLDLTDPKREAQIVRDKLALLKIGGWADAHHQIAIATYGNAPQLLVPKDKQLGTLVNMVAVARPQTTPVDLSSILDRAMDMLSLVPAERRAIFVFTHGHSDRELSVELIGLRARAGGISLNFILAPSVRRVDLAALKQITTASGGLLVGEDQREGFVQAPFQLLDSGGSASFPLKDARRYVWERNAEMKIIVGSEGGELALVSEVQVPRAGIAETAEYVWQHHPAGTMASGAVVITLAGIVAAVGIPSWRRRLPQLSVGEGSVAEQFTRSNPQQTVEERDSGPPFEVLWHKLRAQLRQRGELPLKHDRMTPAEIGDYVQGEKGDIRVQEFVRSFYYPWRYGNEPGPLTEAEAHALVLNLEAGRNRPKQAASPTDG